MKNLAVPKVVSALAFSLVFLASCGGTPSANEANCAKLAEAMFGADNEMKKLTDEQAKELDAQCSAGGFYK